MPKRFFDIIGPIYDWIIRSAPPASLIDYLQLTPNCNERILEIGAGTGRTVRNLSSKCRYLWLLDPSIHMLRQAKLNLPDVRVTHGYAEELPFKNNFFNRILVVDSFHHWDDHLKGLLEISRVLKPKGLFILIDFDPSTKTGHFIKSMEVILGMGSRFFTPLQIRFLHAQAGLKIQTQKYISSGTFLTISSPIEI